MEARQSGIPLQNKISIFIRHADDLPIRSFQSCQGGWISTSASTTSFKFTEEITVLDILDGSAVGRQTVLSVPPRATQKTVGGGTASSRSGSSRGEALRTRRHPQ